jgi:formate hydrogenlyase subunit 6/NADH:ubiquinone oxidoreductase subunit I
MRKSLRGYIVPHLLRTLLRKRETIHYPLGELVLPEAYRGALVVDISRCVGCGRCARDCPCQALTVTRLPDGGVQVVQDYGACCECGQCELSCPRDAIRLVPQFHAAGTDRDEMELAWERSGQQEPD